MVLIVNWSQYSVVEQLNIVVCQNESSLHSIDYLPTTNLFTVVFHLSGKGEQ